MKKFIIIISIISGVVILFCSALIITNTKILYSAAKMEELGAFVCDYFNGTGTTMKVVLFTADNFVDKIGCPFLTRRPELIIDERYKKQLINPTPEHPGNTAKLTTGQEADYGVNLWNNF